MAPFTIIQLLGRRKITKNPKKEAEFATRNGAIVACILVAAGTAFSLIGILPGPGKEWGTYAGPGNFIDLLVLFACALGMFRKSRVASVTAFTYYLAGRIIVLTNDPEAWLLLILSPQFNGDQKFVDAIRDSVSRLEVSHLGSVHLGMSPAEVELAKGKASSVVRDDSTPRMGWIYGDSPKMAERRKRLLVGQLLCRSSGRVK